MRIVHTADWHLGNCFYGHDRMVEHRHFLNWLLNVLRQQLPDVLIISGNIFYSVHPSASAVRLLYDFLLEAVDAVRGLQIVMIAGSRDSSERLEAAAGLLKRHNIYVRGKVSYTQDGNINFENLILPLSRRLHTEAEMVCLAIPYLRSNDYPEGLTLGEGMQFYFENIRRQLHKSDFRKLPVMATAHFHVQGAEITEDEHREWWLIGGQDNIRAEVVGNGLSYVALGNVHRAQRIDYDRAEIYYSGSVLPMSFADANLKYGVQVVELDALGNTRVDRVTYAPLRHLLIIPEGEATVEHVFESIRNLPKRKKNECGDDWPYLEIRLQTRQSDPNLLHEVNEALMDRAVHFCHMVREWTEKPVTASLSSSRRTKSSLDPLEMAKTIYASRQHEILPEELVTRFKEAEQHCR